MLLVCRAAVLEVSRNAVRAVLHMRTYAPANQWCGADVQNAQGKEGRTA